MGIAEFATIYLMAFCHSHCLSKDFDFGVYKNPNCYCAVGEDMEAILKPFTLKVKKNTSLVVGDSLTEDYRPFESEAW
jgi:hypothetical protein